MHYLARRLSSIVAPLLTTRLGSATGVCFLAGSSAPLSTLRDLYLPETVGQSGALVGGTPGARPHKMYIGRTQKLAARARA